TTRSEQLRAREQARGVFGARLRGTFQAWSEVEQFILVRAVRERVAGHGFGEDVDDGSGKRVTQVAEKRNGQNRVANKSIPNNQNADRALIREVHDSIDFRITRAPGLEAFVHPKVLLGGLADVLLDQLVNANAVRVGV